jgi:hypothetical protein
MSIRRIVIIAVATPVVALVAIAARGASNTAWAEEDACLGNTGPLCRTVSVQTCREWRLSNLTGGITGVGVGTVCAEWVTQTFYYYYDYAPGGTTMPRK